MASRNNLFLDTPRSTGLSRERGSDRESHSIINDYLSDNSSVPTTYFAAMLPVEEIVQARLRKQTSLGDFVSNFDYFSSMKCRLNGVRETDYWPADTDETTYNIEIQVGQWVSEGRVSAERRNAIDERDVAKRQGAEGTHNTHTPELHQRPKHMSRDGKIQQGRSVSPPIIIDKRFRKARTILPIIIDKHTLNSKPDSGSEENIMAFDLTARLGLNIEDNEEHRREFRIANGNVVKALGRVHALCAFAKDRGVAVVASFYVFRTLVSGIIMGMDFLDLTQTLTKYKYRLDKQIVPQHGICQISALNNPRRRLRCTATGKAMLANADTGAEMDLISRKYAQLRELKCHKLEAGETQVQLADGSVTYLGGKVFLDIKLRTDRGVTGAFYSEALERPFYILAGLTSPLLLGEETLEYMDVFEKYHDSLILETVEESCLDKPEVCTILWSDTADKFFSSGTNAPPPLSDEVADTPADRSLSHRAIQRVKNIFLPKKNPTASLEDGMELFPSFEERLRERDARENYRREVENAAIKRMSSGPEKDRRILEEQGKCNKYEADKQRLLQARSQSISGNPLSGSGNNRGQHITEVFELPTVEGEEEDLYNA